MNEREIKYTPSYGIILFYREGDDIYYLLTQRRDTIEYVISLKPRSPIKMFNHYFSLMTQDERQRILTFIDEKDGFDVLWKDLMLREHFHHNDMYLQAKQKFYANKEYIRHILQTTNSDVNEPNWGFPKGRKMNYESEWEAAKREFDEETQLSSKNIIRVSFDTFDEYFSGTDGRYYSTHYYVCEANKKFAIHYKKCCSPLQERKYTISDEVVNMKWCKLEDACTLLNGRRCQLLGNINHQLSSFGQFPPNGR